MPACISDIRSTSRLAILTYPLRGLRVLYRHMATKWGTFSEPGYLHPGVIYNKAYKGPKDTPLSGSFKPALGCTKTGKVCEGPICARATFHKQLSVLDVTIF